MLFKSEVLTQASGSIGGVTYSHNKAGLYRRARSIPVNPNTGFQEQVRSALTQAVNRWTNVLTPAERAAWDLYAANTPVTGVLGDQIQLSGQNMYIRSATAVSQANTKIALGFGDSLTDVAPVIFDLGDFTSPSLIADVSTGISVAFSNVDQWASEEFSAMIFGMSRPQNPSVNYYNGPWRLIGAVAGNVVPPPSPVVINPAAIASRGYVFAVGQRIWLRVRVFRQDGRLSSERQIGPVLAVA